MKLSALLVLILTAFACTGPKPVQMRELPDNYPLKSVCYGFGQNMPQPVRVADGDSTDIRLCASIQKDGHLGLNLRYIPTPKLAAQEPKQALPIFALVTLDGKKGANASEMFRLEPNPYSGAYEIYLTDGCLVGSFGGCAQGAQKKMMDLFEAVSSGERVMNFDVSLAFFAMKNEREVSWDLYDPLKKKAYEFEISNL